MKSSKVKSNGGSEEPEPEQSDNDDYSIPNTQHDDKAYHQRQQDFLLQTSDLMKIDLILEIFFDFCSVNTLKNCRLVCKQWRELSLKAWRGKAIICVSTKLHQRSPLVLKDYLLQHIENEKRVSSLVAEEPDIHLQLGRYSFKNRLIKSYILEYCKPDMKPINNFARQVTLDMDNIKGNLQCFETVLLNFPSMDCLELRNCEWDWRGESSSKARNLKRLRIYRAQWDYHGIPKRFIFKSFPNLKSFSLEFRTETCYNKNVKSILQCLRDSSKRKVDEVPLNLKELEIISCPPSGSHFLNWDHHFDPKLFKLVAECDFPLETLVLVLDLAFSDKMKINLVIRSIHPLLNSCRESLKYLRTSFCFDIDYFIDCEIHSKMLEWIKLKDLKMKGALKPVSRIKITLNELKEMNVSNGLWGFYLLAHLHIPNLEKLVVEYGKCTKKVNIQEYQVQLLKEKVYQKLESFELLDCYEIPEPETITCIANMMPNLIHLSVPLDKQAEPTEPASLVRA